MLGDDKYTNKFSTKPAIIDNVSENSHPIPEKPDHKNSTIKPQSAILDVSSESGYALPKTPSHQIRTKKYKSTTLGNGIVNSPIQRLNPVIKTQDQGQPLSREVYRPSHPRTSHTNKLHLPLLNLAILTRTSSEDSLPSITSPPIKDHGSVMPLELMPLREHIRSSSRTATTTSNRPVHYSHINDSNSTVINNSKSPYRRLNPR